MSSDVVSFVAGNLRAISNDIMNDSALSNDSVAVASSMKALMNLINSNALTYASSTSMEPRLNKSQSLEVIDK